MEIPWILQWNGGVAVRDAETLELVGDALTVPDRMDRRVVAYAGGKMVVYSDGTTDLGEQYDVVNCLSRHSALVFSTHDTTYWCRCDIIEALPIYLERIQSVFSLAVHGFTSDGGFVSITRCSFRAEWTVRPMQPRFIAPTPCPDADSFQLDNGDGVVAIVANYVLAKSGDIHNVYRYVGDELKLRFENVYVARPEHRKAPLDTQQSLVVSFLVLIQNG
jgi:hypothetical protein